MFLTQSWMSHIKKDKATATQLENLKKSVCTKCSQHPTESKKNAGRMEFYPRC